MFVSASYRTTVLAFICSAIPLVFTLRLKVTEVKKKISATSSLTMNAKKGKTFSMMKHTYKLGIYCRHFYI